MREFGVMATCTSAPSFVSIRARLQILYTAIEPVTPSNTVFPVSMLITSYTEFVGALFAVVAGDEVADRGLCDVAESFFCKECLMRCHDDIRH